MTPSPAISRTDQHFQINISYVTALIITVPRTKPNPPRIYRGSTKYLHFLWAHVAHFLRVGMGNSAQFLDTRNVINLIDHDTFEAFVTLYGA